MLIFLPVEFLAGEVVHTLIGFSNDAESEFIVTGIEASFRYYWCFDEVINY